MKTSDYDEDEAKRAIADRDWWQAFAPEGYNVGGFTYRDVADFHYRGYGHTVTITAMHLKFFGLLKPEVK